MNKALHFDGLNAFALMKAVSTVLDLDIPIQVEDSDRGFLMFNSDTGNVLCSRLSIREIYTREINNPKCYHSTLLIVEKAYNQIAYLDCAVSDETAYGIFSCLHEIGHYIHWKETDAEQFGREEAARCVELQALNDRAQNDADKGMSQEEVYERFAVGYRLIGLEKNADDYAANTIRHVIQAWSE